MQNFSHSNNLSKHTDGAEEKAAVHLNICCSIKPSKIVPQIIALKFNSSSQGEMHTTTHPKNGGVTIGYLIFGKRLDGKIK